MTRTLLRHHLRPNHLSTLTPAAKNRARTCRNKDRVKQIYKKVGSLLVFASVVGPAFAWHYRADLLPQAIELWSISDPVRPADAVAVLGGGMQTRPFAAADFYRHGLAPKVLVSNAGSKA